MHDPNIFYVYHQFIEDALDCNYNARQNKNLRIKIK